MFIVIQRQQEQEEEEEEEEEEEVHQGRNEPLNTALSKQPSLLEICYHDHRRGYLHTHTTVHAVHLPCAEFIGDQT